MLLQLLSTTAIAIIIIIFLTILIILNNLILFNKTIHKCFHFNFNYDIISDMALLLFLAKKIIKNLQTVGLNYGPRKEVPINIDGGTQSYSMVYEDPYGTLYKIYGGNLFDDTFAGW